VDGTADSYKAFGTALWSEDRQVSGALKELAFLRSSIVNQCPPWLSSHVVSARRRGVSDAQIEALEDPAMWTEVFDDSSIAVLRLADALCGDSSTIDPELIATLRTHFTEAELAELVLTCGQANLNNRAGNAAKQLLG